MGRELGKNSEEERKENGNHDIMYESKSVINKGKCIYRKSIHVLSLMALVQ